MCKKIYIYLALVISIINVSCDDWLDVSSDTEIKENEQFNSQTGFEEALTGCYIKMASPDIYGRNFSWYIPEILTNNFVSPESKSVNHIIENFDYKNRKIVNSIDRIWEKQYNVIANVNNILQNIDNGELSTIPYNIIKGEALALRAYCYMKLVQWRRAVL